MRKDTLLNILLLPRKFYQNLTDKKTLLYIGILLVGIVDSGLYFNYQFNTLFNGKPQDIFMRNVILTCVFAVLIGLIDVIFFSLPLFDLFKKFKTEPDTTVGKPSLVRLMKVYIVVNILQIPVQLLILYLVNVVNQTESIPLAYLAQALDLAVIIWFNAVITRGINSLYRFHPFYKRLVFPVVFIWSYVLGGALGMIAKWAGMLLK